MATATTQATVRWSAIVLGLLVLLSACGAPVPTSSTPPSPTRSASSPGAESEVEQGLQAHVAGDYDRALSHYRRALAMDPANKFAHYNIGVIDQMQGRMTDAEVNYRAALAIDQDYVPALFNLATVRTLADGLDEAAELYGRVTQLEPDRADAYLNLGLVLARLGRTQEAEAALQRAIELDPDLAVPDVTFRPSP